MYKAMNLDTDKVLDELERLHNRNTDMYNKKIAEAKSFFDGYELALDHVRSLTECCNCEKAKSSSGIAEGAEKDG